MNSVKSGIADHQKGTTWDGISIFISEDDSSGNKIPKDLTGAEIIAEFKNNRDVVFTYKNLDGSILVPNPTDGIIYFVSSVIEHPESLYYFDVKIILPNGDIVKIPTHTWNIYK